MPFTSRHAPRVRYRPPVPTLRRALRGALPALVLAFPPLYWVLDAERAASYTSLGRDQGIFQYVAWAISRGAVDYRDVRDVNGPLTHAVHLAFLALGGRDEHRFRTLDLATTAITFAIAGACLPGILRKSRVTWFERAAWGMAGWVVLLGQYLLYLYWDLAQRESFGDWFLFPSLGLQLVAQGAMRRSDSKRPLALLAVAAGLSVVTWFAKPTFALFTLVQAVTLAVDRDARAPLAARAKWFVAGGALGALPPLAFLARYADVGAFLRISLHDVPAMYRFIWPRTFAEILALPGNAPTLGFALVTSAVVVGLIVDGAMPRRALAIGLGPACGIVMIVAQGKGFPYHFHPITASTCLNWMLLVAWLGDRTWTAPRRELARFAPLAAAAILAMRVTTSLSTSPHVSQWWIADKGATAEDRESRDYLVYFRTVDFFPVEMRDAARYLREHTRPDERVQTYAMDPYVLFLAERASATPYIYAYDLDVDAALGGAYTREGLHPNDAQRAAIRAIQAAHEDDLLARLAKDPPAAFVFIDKSPLMTWPDAWVDLQNSVPRTAAWVKEHYRQTFVSGEDRVWLRRDRAEGIADATPAPVDLEDAQKAAEASPSP
jgi:hypothetical protein